MRTHGSSPERAPHRAPAHRPSQDAHGVMHLQRTAGNASVSEMLGARPVVQRGLFDMLGGMLGGAGGLRQQAASLGGQGVQAGIGALSSMIGGPFGSALGGMAPGLSSAASSLIGGDTRGALGALQSTGASAAAPLAQSGMGMLGNAVGGQAGGFLSSMGAPIGQGLSSVISGGNPVQAGMGVAQAAAPGLLQMGRGLFGF